MFDIIIPLYNNRQGLIDSLESLKQNNISVIIIDDNSSETYDDIINYFRNNNFYLDIYYEKLNKNYGPGYARQYGLEISKKEYVYFLDAGNTFYEDNTLFLLNDMAKKTQANIIAGSFLVFNENNEYIFYSGDNELLKGKLFKKEFLNKYNITFPKEEESSYCSEDMYFVDLCFLIIKNFQLKICFLGNTIIEVDHYNCNSLTNSNYNTFYFKECPKMYYMNYLKIKDIAEKLQINKKHIQEYAYTIFFRYINFIQQAKDANASDAELKKYYYKFLNISSLEKNTALVFEKNKDIYINFLSW